MARSICVGTVVVFIERDNVIEQMVTLCQEKKREAYSLAANWLMTNFRMKSINGIVCVMYHLIPPSCVGAML